jgi:ubiquinone/menaquinone biosynthesis C-methylase UbiE
MPSLDWNRRVWQEYTWLRGGEEWTDEMALGGRVSSQRWKDSLVATFITANVKPQMAALEIGCGHGRWSTELAKRVKTLRCVDIEPKCVEFTSRLFEKRPGVVVMQNDGTSLPFVVNASIDFVFSFDTFVHIDEPETRAYVKEFARVMKRQAMGVIHHAGDPTAEQRARGCRSDVTAKRFIKILNQHGFVVIRQGDSWDGGDVRLAGDTITVFVRP